MSELRSAPGSSWPRDGAEREACRRMLWVYAENESRVQPRKKSVTQKPLQVRVGRRGLAPLAWRSERTDNTQYYYYSIE